jgi:hypothetical protein
MEENALGMFMLHPHLSFVLTSTHQFLPQNHHFNVVVPFFSMPSKQSKSKTMLQGGLVMSFSSTSKLGPNLRRILLVGGG